MTEKELISFCKYYKGEKECPFTDQNKSMFWFYECMWVNMTMKDSLCKDYIEEYNYAGLASFNSDDGVPVSLKALLFNRFGKTSMGSLKETGDFFRKFYLENY
jgi:hypothetical protein